MRHCNHETKAHGDIDVNGRDGALDMGTCGSLSASAKKVLSFLQDHRRKTGKPGVYMSPEEFAGAVELDSVTAGKGLRELTNAGIAALYGRSPYGVPYIHLTKTYIRSIDDNTTTSTPLHDELNLNTGDGVGTPLSHPADTTLAAPQSLPDLQVHPPGRLHRVVLYCEGTLDPQRTHLLRQASDKGKQVERNNCYGTRLPLSTWQISSKGRLCLYIKDPSRMNEAVEEFAGFCADELRLGLNATFQGSAECEIGYPVSGNVKKYARCTVRVELRGYKATIFFDKSSGDLELEAHVKGRGPPEALRSFTTMIVANGSMARYLVDELPAKVAHEIKKLEEREK